MGGLALLGRKLEWEKVRSAFVGADLRFALLAVVVWPLSMVLQGLRWHPLARTVLRVRVRDVLAAFFVGAAATAILPLRAGEAVRVELLARSARKSRATAVGTVALDHAVNGVVMFLFAAALPFVLPVSPWVKVVVWGGLVAVLLLVAALLRAARAPAGPDRPGLRAAIGRVREGLLGLKHPRAVTSSMAAALGAWVLEIVFVALCLRAFHLPADAAHAMGVLFGVNLLLAIPAPPGNLGNFELGAGVSLVALGGGGAEKAAAFALGYHALQLLPTLLGGAAFLPLAGRHALRPAAQAA